MTNVKQKQQSVLQVNKSHPWKELRWRVLQSVVLLLVVAFLAAWFGYSMAKDEVLSAELKEAKREVSRAQDLLKTARQELAIQTTAAEVAQEAHNRLREELRDYHSRIAESEEAVSFYKNVMSDVEGQERLRIEKVDIQDNSDNASLKMVLAQSHEGNPKIEGQIKITVAGEQDGEEKELQLGDLTSFNDLRYGFRYIEELDVDLVLPEGFTPQTLELTLQPAGQMKSVSKTVTWPD